MAEWYKNNVVATDESGMIADLSEYADDLMVGKDIAVRLTGAQEDKIASYVGTLIRLSHQEISARYPYWKEADQAHDVFVRPDATEFREKAVIGTTRAIADTVVTYMMAALTGRNPMFQLEGLDSKSRRASAILERVLHAQQRQTAAESKWLQLFTDCTRYGMAPSKVLWDGKKRTNRFVNINPRRFYPDPRVTWGDWDASQFLAHTDLTSYDNLQASGGYEKLKEFPGLRFNSQTGGKSSWVIKRFDQEKGRGFTVDPLSPKATSTSGGYFTIGKSRIHDEVWVKIPGWQIGLPQIGMGWFVVSILDEGVCIKFQLSPHGQQFPIVTGGMYHDSHKTFSQSLYDILLPMHHIQTWLLRSRIDNVQSSLTNLIFADPTQVDIMDIIERNPYGIVKAMPGFDASKGLHIAQIPDVTRGHWNDINSISDLQQRLSAASDAQQGLPTSDVRTATEISRLTQLGSQRLGVIARVLSSTTVRPLVHMMVSNIQDALQMEGSIKVDDSLPEILRPFESEDYLEYGIDDLQGDVNYVVVDGTLPLEPTRSPQMWMQMIQAATTSGLAMELDTKQMALEGIRAMGISDIDQFKIGRERQGKLSPSQKLLMMEKMRGVSVQGDEQLGKEISAGNLVPAMEAGQ